MIKKNKPDILLALISKDKNRILNALGNNRLSKSFLFIRKENQFFYTQGNERIVLSLSEKEEMINNASKMYDLTIIEIPDNGR